MGAKKQPTYRIVVTDSRAPRNGAFIEIIGQYNPRVDPPYVKLDEEKALKWLRQGAQPSEGVQPILNKLGVLQKVKAS